MPVQLNNPIILSLGMLVLVNLFLIGLLFWQFRKYRFRQDGLLLGEEVGNFEEIILKQKKILAMHNKNLKELGDILEELVDNNKSNISQIGLVKFNPFANDGGNISFSMALLNGHGAGIVISSLHNREVTRVYAKNIIGGDSHQQLTDEEQQAIKNAKTKMI